MPSPSPILTKDGKRLIRSRYKKISVDGHIIDEHRWLMEQHLGRKLERHEHVHHRDGDTHNNDLSNLELLTKSEHFKVHRPNFKKVAWSKELREEYRQKFVGEKGPAAKLTQAEANEIRWRALLGENIRRLGKEFGVAHSQVVRIK